MSAIVLRVTPLNAAFGVITSVPSRHLLLAMRRTDDVQLVTYEWHWRQGN